MPKPHLPHLVSYTYAHVSHPPNGICVVYAANNRRLSQGWGFNFQEALRHFFQVNTRIHNKQNGTQN